MIKGLHNTLSNKFVLIKKYMKKSTVWTIVIVVVLVVLGIILVSAPKSPDLALDEEVKGEEETLPGETISEVLEDAEAVIPGGSLVTEQGEVVTPAGEVVSNEALPGSPTAPQQSRPLTEAEVPKEAVTLTVSPFGFEPNEFSVKAGEIVTISITATEQTHVFKFDDPSLQAVAVGIASNETRAITFKAPAKGEYTFFCDVPGHRARGETGVMKVE